MTNEKIKETIGEITDLLKLTDNELAKNIHGNSDLSNETDGLAVTLYSESGFTLLKLTLFYNTDNLLEMLLATESISEENYYNISKLPEDEKIDELCQLYDFYYDRTDGYLIFENIDKFREELADYQENLFFELLYKLDYQF